MRRLHVVDGTYELFRAHFSPRPSHSDPSGKDNKATVGMLMSLMALLKDPAEAVTHLAVAFDNPIRSFRNRLFPFYKSDEGVPPELRSQFDLAEEAVSALGVVVWSMKEHEADDAMATAPVKYAGAFDEFRLMTPDKDMGQCLTRPSVVLVDRRRQKTMNGEAFRASKGYLPESVPDFLGLVGDTADGIPGLVGFGEKSTATLLAMFPHLEDIPEDPDQWPRALRSPAVLNATLRANWNDALLYRKLATLVDDVPLAQSASHLAFTAVDEARFWAFCDSQGMRRR
jgi:5'-3' exonuclease